MEPKLFKKFFKKLSDDLTVEFMAKEQKPFGSCLKVKNNLPALDALELLEKNDCLMTEDGLVVTKKESMKRAIKTLFYVLITQLEYHLYKTLKPRVQSLKELQAGDLNDLIRLFLAQDELFKMQTVYAKRSEMKKDLKAISSFRNLIMHSNKKMDLEAEFSTILKRKRQALKLLGALEQLYPIK
jgi:hypothetical protein